MENSDEPLNLTIKKMPIAIVAPFHHVDQNHNIKINNNNDDKLPANNNNNNKNEEDVPQDLSRKTPTSENGLDLSTKKQPEKIYHNEQLRKYLCKDEQSDNSYNKNTFNGDNQIVNDYNKLRDFYENIANKGDNNNIYSFLNNLCDNKFLSAWYMNTMLTQQNPYLNYAPPPSPYECKSDTSPNRNRILNNLLDKKPYNPCKFPTGFDALIKNEMKGDNKHPSRKQNGSQMDHKNNIDAKNAEANEKKKPHIKKPLNAFMLYMKEMRAKVVAECTLKESAAINQILGRRWHSLSREEQAKYYEKARQERQLHMQLYPGWSARDNYGYGTKKKKRKKERTPIDSGGNSMKKCRARYGLDQQNQWCKPCSPENSSHGGGTSAVHGGLLHGAGGGAATAQSPQEPTYVNL
ncbi:unnamed protein product [Brassicogethes aeneus]|uniref:dTCF n=1 Tax=Brassicogethes aeneus TaxID=1431903 RepID=A0A9P0F8N6_BRAAE|nr:unnamed protein product [Brassicogethes aeneus]